MAHISDKDLRTLNFLCPSSINQPIYSYTWLIVRHYLMTSGPELYRRLNFFKHLHLKLYFQTFV